MRNVFKIAKCYADIVYTYIAYYDRIHFCKGIFFANKVSYMPDPANGYLSHTFYNYSNALNVLRTARNSNCLLSLSSLGCTSNDNFTFLAMMCVGFFLLIISPNIFLSSFSLMALWCSIAFCLVCAMFLFAVLQNLTNKGKRSTRRYIYIYIDEGGAMNVFSLYTKEINSLQAFNTA